MAQQRNYHHLSTNSFSLLAQQQQKPYLKDTTDVINYIENTKVPADVILVSMNVTSLYTNIPQEEGIHTVCRAYETFFIIDMNKVETEILSQSELKLLVWKRFIDDIFSLWTINRDRIEQFIEQANNHHPTIKFTAEISDKDTYK